jgi:hypothetical protein
MKPLVALRGSLVALAVLGTCCPQLAFAAGVPVAVQPKVLDVALAEGGVMYGQVVDAQGVAQVRVPVLLRAADRDVARAATDDRGYFAVSGLQAGVYQVVAGGSRGEYRLWAPGTSPPTAQSGALLVADRAVVRGQRPLLPGSESTGCGTAGCNPCATGLQCWLSNPWVVGGIIATAVAVPVIIHNSKRPASP